MANHAIFDRPMDGPIPKGFEQAIFGMGCYWGVERLFWEQPGIWMTQVGFAGGTVPNPTYAQVCEGDTGHAEVVRVRFDPALISLREILEIFFVVHDPTSLNRQGNDVGTQYRSAIYAEDDAQLQRVQAWVQAAQTHFDQPLVTEVALLQCYLRAEDYHQDYFNQHPYQGYCMMVVAPKVQKFQQTFADWQR